MSPAWLLALAFLLDAAIGEPPNALHPVVWMGNAIAPLKRMAQRTPQVELIIGAAYVALATCGFALLGWGIEQLLAEHSIVRSLVDVYLLWSCFALRGLVRAGEHMLDALNEDDLLAARRALGSLCSRDPSELSARELAGSAIESLSENASDSVVAPLFYFALFGVPGALFYRAANTLDAMVGYHGRFEYLGKVAARLDDLLNLIPARLTAFFLYGAAKIRRQPTHAALQICLRDHALTESPNAGWPMAMAAGLLGVQLDKRAAYTLGHGLAQPDGAALARMLRLLRDAGSLAVLALVFGLWLVSLHG